MKSLLAGLVVALTAVACSVPPVTTAPIDEGDAPSTNNKTVSKTPATATTGSAVPVDTTSSPTPVDDTKAPTTVPVTPAAKGKTFTGTLDSTNVVSFGGNGFCNYQVVLTKMTVSMTFDAQNRPIASKVSSTMTETVVQDGCNATPLGSLPYAFTFAGPASDATTIAETPTADNQMGGTLDVSASSGSATKMHVKLEFHRTGASASQLDWTIDTELDLVPSS